MNKQEREDFHMTVVQQFAFTMDFLMHDPQFCQCLTESKDFRNLLIRVDEYAVRHTQALR